MKEDTIVGQQLAPSDDELYPPGYIPPDFSPVMQAWMVQRNEHGKPVQLRRMTLLDGSREFTLSEADTIDLAEWCDRPDFAEFVRKVGREIRQRRGRAQLN